MAGPSPELIANIDDTVHQMRENIDKISQRGERLNSLELKTDQLNDSVNLWRRSANKVRKRMWRESMCTACSVFGGIAILAVIVVPVVVLRIRK